MFPLTLRRSRCAFGLAVWVLMAQGLCGCRSGFETINNVMSSPDAATTDAADATSSDASTPMTSSSLIFGQARLLSSLIGTGAEGIGSQTYDAASLTWSPLSPFDSQGGGWRWLEGRISAATDPEEMVLGIGLDLADVKVQVQRSTDAMWVSEWSTTFGSASPGTFTETRFAGIAFEQNSGNALVVYSVDTETPVFRAWSDGRWSEPETLPINDGPGGPNPDLTTSSVRWVELASRAASDEIALAFVDTDGALGAIIWDGSAWNTASAIAQTATSNIGTRVFDLAYEKNSGDLLLVWGTGSTDFAYATRSATDGIWTTGNETVSGAFDSEYIDLEAAPGGDSIALGIGDLDGTKRLGLGTWNGASWEAVEEYDLLVGAEGDFVVAVAWLNADEAVAVYGGEQSLALQWATWSRITPNDWVVRNLVPVPRKNLSESLRLLRLPGQSQLLALVTDEAGFLHAAHYDGSDWTVVPDGSAINTVLYATQTLPFTAYTHPE